MSTICMHERNEPVAACWAIVRDKHRQGAKVGCLLFLDQPWSCGQKNQEVTPTVHSSSYTGKTSNNKTTQNKISLISASRFTRGQLVLHHPQPRLLLPRFLLPITRNSQQQEWDWDSSPLSYDFNLICQCAYAKSICWLWSQNQSARFNHWTRFQGPSCKIMTRNIATLMKTAPSSRVKALWAKSQEDKWLLFSFFFFCRSGILRAVQLIIAGKVSSVKQRQFLSKQRGFHNKQGKVSHLCPSRSQNLISASNKVF